MSDPRAIVRQFRIGGEVDAPARLVAGLINDSYRVTRRGGEGGYLLQRLNERVFPRPDLVMENLVRVTRHLAGRGCPTLTLVPTRDGADWLRDDTGSVWRVFQWIPNAVTKERATTPGECYRCARAFGEFLGALDDFDGTPLHETIPGFHDTRRRFERLESAVREDQCRRVRDARLEVDAVLGAREVAEVLPPKFASGELRQGVAHNDTKIANVLFDRTTDAALCVVDLDTVMPGSPLADFGDLVRSCAGAAAEDEADVSRVAVDLQRFDALARGFLEACGGVLTAAERGLLVFAGRWITLEQSIRFLTDHLEGDRYYQVSRPGHNLVRCRAQLALYRSLTEHASELEAVVRGI